MRPLDWCVLLGFILVAAFILTLPWLGHLWDV